MEKEFNISGEMISLNEQTLEFFKRYLDIELEKDIPRYVLERADKVYDIKKADIDRVEDTQVYEQVPIEKVAVPGFDFSNYIIKDTNNVLVTLNEAIRNGFVDYFNWNRNVAEVEKKQRELNETTAIHTYRYGESRSPYLIYSKAYDKYFFGSVGLGRIDTGMPNIYIQYLYKHLVARLKNEDCEKQVVFARIEGKEYSDKLLKASQKHILKNNLEKLLREREYDLLYGTKAYLDGQEEIFIQGDFEIRDKVRCNFKQSLKNEKDSLEYFELVENMVILKNKFGYEFTPKLNDNNEMIFLHKGKEVKFSDTLNYIKNEFEALEKIISAIDKNLQSELISRNELQNQINIKKESINNLKDKLDRFGRVSNAGIVTKFKYYFIQRENSLYEKIVKRFSKRVDRQLEASTMEETKNTSKKIEHSKENLLYMLNVKTEKENKQTELKETKKRLDSEYKVVMLQEQDLINKNNQIKNNSKNLFQYFKFLGKFEMDTYLYEDIKYMESEREKIEKICETDFTQNIGSNGYLNFTDNKEEITQLGIKEDKKVRTILTNEERNALFVYKTTLYTQINLIRNDLLANGENKISKVVEQNLRDKYNEIITNKKAYAEQGVNPISVNQEWSSEEKLNGIINFESEESFIKSVKNQLNPLEGALNKIKAEENIVVYRGTAGEEITKDIKPGDILNSPNIVSTSTDPNKAAQFMTIRNETASNKITNMYRIEVPKGTPCIFYTAAIFDDRDKTIGMGFCDEQREVAFDAQNVNMVVTNISEEKTTYYGGEKVRFIDVRLETKERQLEKENRQQSLSRTEISEQVSAALRPIECGENEIHQKIQPKRHINVNKDELSLI